MAKSKHFLKKMPAFDAITALLAPLSKGILFDLAYPYGLLAERWQKSLKENDDDKQMGKAGSIGAVGSGSGWRSATNGKCPG